jgi:hypothetical protein
VAGRESPLWQRIALAATVAIALVGMHHLTTLGCSEPVAHHSVVHIVEPETSLASSPGNPSSGDASVEDLTPGLVCLALLVAVGVVFRAVGGVLTRRRDVQRVHQEWAVTSRIDDPPDLHVLSISQT